MPRTRRRTLATALVLAPVLVALVACAPDADPVTSSSPSESAPAPAASASPTESASPAASLPANCESAYSPAMLATLHAETPPLNDPGITLLSSDQAGLLELLETVPTLRCTWGPPGPSGLATTVSIVDAAQAEDVLSQLATAGFGCEASGDLEICSVEQRGITLDDQEYVRGETHAVGKGVWVATAWINVLPDGYAQDVVDTVAG